MKRFTFEIGPGWGSRWAEARHGNGIVRLLFEMKPGFEEGIGLNYRAVDFDNCYFVKVVKDGIGLWKRVKGTPYHIKGVRRSVSYGSHEVAVVLLGTLHVLIYDSLPIIVVNDSTFTSGDYVGASFWNAKSREKVTVEVLP